MNRIFRVIGKSVLNLTIILMPALLLLISDFYTCFYRGTIGNFIVLYFPARLLTALVTWKRPCGGLALPVGFLLAPLFDPLWMSLLGRKYTFLFTVGKNAMMINLAGYYFIYALPFAVASSIPTIISWYQRNISKY